jgi:dipeptidase
VLAAGNGLAVADLLAILRDHAGVVDDAEPIPSPICMHEIPPRAGATAASIVARLRPNDPPPLAAVAWHSFGSPCLGAVVPIYFQTGRIPAALGVGGAAFDPASPWWLVERLQRRCDAYPELQAPVRAALGAFERQAFAEAADAEDAAHSLPPAEADRVLAMQSEILVGRALALVRELDEWTAKRCRTSPPLHERARAHWDGLNRPVGIDLAVGQFGAALSATNSGMR